MRWIKYCFYRFCNLFYKQKVIPLKIIEGIYPANMLYIRETSKFGLVLVGMKPCKRICFTQKKPIAIDFPYTYFIIFYNRTQSNLLETNNKFLFRKLSVCFSPVELVDWGGIVYSSDSLSNYYDRGEMYFCLGDGYPNGLFNNLRELAEAAINGFWKTDFQYAAEMELDYRSGKPLADISQTINCADKFSRYECVSSGLEKVDELARKLCASRDRIARRKRRKRAHRKT